MSPRRAPAGGANRAGTGVRRLLAVVLVVAVLGALPPAVGVGSGPPDGYEPNDSPAEAAEIGDGEYDGLRIEGGESDFFAVDLAAGERLRAAVSFSHARGDLDLAVYGPDLDRLAAGQSVTDDESASVVAPESGTYYVEVYGFDGATAPYALSVSTERSENDRFEPNDSPGEAVPITAGGGLDDLRIVTGERDVFAVNLEAGERFRASIRFAHDDGDLDLRVLGPDGDPVRGSYSVTDNESVAVTATRSATYYVSVLGRANATAGYSLDAERRDLFRSDRRPRSDAKLTNLTATARGGNVTVGVQGPTATPGSSATVRYNLTNAGDRPRTFVLESGLSDLPTGWTVDGTAADGGRWYPDRGVWVFQGVDPGERVVAGASVAVPVWADVPATETFRAAVYTRERRLTATAGVQVRSTSVAAAVDRNDDGRISDAELLAAIEWWRAGEPIPGADVRISDAELEVLIERWRT